MQISTVARLWHLTQLALPRRAERSQAGPGAHEAHDLFRGQQRLARRQLNALRRHAIGAAQVAPLGQRDAQVCVHPPARHGRLAWLLGSVLSRVQWRLVKDASRKQGSAMLKQALHFSLATEPGTRIAQ